MEYGKEPPRTYAEKLMYTEILDPSVRFPEWDNPGERILDCIVCGTPTKHVKLTDGWMCACGFFVEVVEMSEYL